MRRTELCILTLAVSVFMAVSAAAGPEARPSESAPEYRISPLQASILGLVEGITEYLPVSPTGHLILAGRLLGLDREGAAQDSAGRFVKSPALDAFDIVIQLGAILAVLGLYRKRVGSMCMGLTGRDKDGLRLVGLLAVAFIPAAASGLMLGDTIMENLYNPRSVAFALAAGGFVMVAAGPIHKLRRGPEVCRIEDIAWLQAVVIGLAQCIALWPGMSRSMVTILAGLFTGMSLAAAAEFSFLLALPTLGAATLYSAARHWPELMAAVGPLGMTLGMAVSCVSAVIAVKGFVKWLTSHGLMPFGIYRIIVGVIVLLIWAN